MRVLISVGEPSGELYAERLVNRWRTAFPDTEFYALGGELLQKAGVSILYPYADMSVMGIVEVWKARNTIVEAFNTITRFIVSTRPDFVILVDFPGFNLKLARFARGRGCKVIYYSLPQLWIWGGWRVKALKQYVDLRLVILPFEQQFYERLGLKTYWVGHPLVEIINDELKHVVDGPEVFLGLLPGSRVQEVRSILPIMLEVACHFNDKKIGIAPTKNTLPVVKSLVNNLPIVYFENPYTLMRKAKFLLVTSGTATLEAALIGTPMAILYRTSYSFYWVAKLLTHVKYIGLPNIIAGHEIVPEFIQHHCNADTIIQYLDEFFSHPELERKMRNELNKVRTLLGDKIASREAINLIKQHFYG
ncbi:lipid-A-disaccharide synthase [candidate division WOR-3 bacterium]|nr:lipid-A-disaccharide synthase [candidate division WOR-3 bacterium]